MGTVNDCDNAHRPSRMMMMIWSCCHPQNASPAAPCHDLPIKFPPAPKLAGGGKAKHSIFISGLMCYACSLD